MSCDVLAIWSKLESGVGWVLVFFFVVNFDTGNVFDFD